MREDSLQVIYGLKVCKSSGSGGLIYKRLYQVKYSCASGYFDQEVPLFLK